MALLQWGTLALLTTLTGRIPPLQLTAMAFAVGSLVGFAAWWPRRFHPRRLLHLPPAAWLVGVGGLFGYHLFFFLALRSAPVMEANLINYLWPLLMVLFSSLLPGEALRFHHLAGTLLGFLGAALLLTGGRGLNLDPQHLPGYLAALACALVWSSYSVLSRRLGSVPTEAVAAFCAVTAVLAAAAHLLLEQTVQPAGGQWLVILLMGLGPLGAAFFLWDVGVKRGNIKTLGALSYFEPFLSTMVLMAGSEACLTWQVGVACVLITAGAVVAAGLLRPRGRGITPGSG